MYEKNLPAVRLISPETHADITIHLDKKNKCSVQDLHVGLKPKDLENRVHFDIEVRTLKHSR